MLQATVAMRFLASGPEGRRPLRIEPGGWRLTARVVAGCSPNAIVRLATDPAKEAGVKFPIGGMHGVH